MNISKKGLDLIEQFESFQPEPYICPAGKLTIGYGHVIKVGEKFTSINIHEAEKILANDCKIAEQAVNNVADKVNQNQYDALCAFTFNVGNHAFLTSTLRKKILYNDMQGAANEFDKWIYANGKVLKGLAKRRAAEKELFLL